MDARKRTTHFTDSITASSLFRANILFHLSATTKPNGVPVEYRLDDGKLQRRNWDHSTDGSGAFFSDVEFNTLVYGHFMPHKENTNPPVRKLVIGVPEYSGAQIQVEFGMPEPTAVAEACGVVLHKK